jgi:general secretion pathway protein E
METAEMAVQASLTGHLVFSTLHTNDSAGAITRLVNMGIEPFLVTSSTIAIQAQRLVRRICEALQRVLHGPEEEHLRELGIAEPRAKPGRLPPWAASSAPIAATAGRTGIFELL